MFFRVELMRCVDRLDYFFKLIPYNGLWNEREAIPQILEEYRGE